MMLITLLAIGLLVYVAIAAFAYHDAYEIRAGRRAVSPGAAVDHRHDAADPRLTQFYLRIAAAGALVTCGIGLIAQAVTADLGASGRSLVFSHQMADWVFGIVLSALGVAVLVGARRTARRQNGEGDDRGRPDD